MSGGLAVAVSRYREAEVECFLGLEMPAPDGGWTRVFMVLCVYKC